jgi:hypothetical protein
MAGFLDPKQRVMDAILTEIGRLQMVKGEFKVKYVSFSDAGVDYVDAGDGVLEPIEEKLFFEPFNLESDEIIPEVDGSGKFIIDQQLPDNLYVKDGVLLQDTVAEGFQEVDGYSMVTSFTQNTTDRFDSLNILNTISSITEFTVSPSTFSVEEPSSGIDPSLSVGSREILPLSIDPRFENQINMRFLPPTYSFEGEQTLLKSFNKWTDTTANDIDLNSRLAMGKRIDEITGKTVGTKTRITLGPENSDDYESYNLLGQVFVKKNQSIKKYLIIDAGEFFNEESEPMCRIYYLGFMYKDEFGTTKFIREFSMIFHNGGI